MQAFLLLVTNDYFGLIVIEFGQCTTECGQLLLNLARFIAKFGQRFDFRDFGAHCATKFVDFFVCLL